MSGNKSQTPPIPTPLTNESRSGLTAVRISFEDFITTVKEEIKVKDAEIARLIEIRKYYEDRQQRRKEEAKKDSSKKPEESPPKTSKKPEESPPKISDERERILQTNEEILDVRRERDLLRLIENKEYLENVRKMGGNTSLQEANCRILDDIAGRLQAGRYSGVTNPEHSEIAIAVEIRHVIEQKRNELIRKTLERIGPHTIPSDRPKTEMLPVTTPLPAAQESSGRAESASAPPAATTSSAQPPLQPGQTYRDSVSVTASPPPPGPRPPSPRPQRGKFGGPKPPIEMQPMGPS